ncbi:MAG TPA: hypothetical protein VMW38_14755 [Terriglobia bacterium]|nr:hypothetical protein [Terriglobia bacterium]
MREFRFDTATRRAYLNGKVYFLRGSNITLHRFFEDPKSATLPWQESWVRKMLGEIPKKMHWNSFRFCIGPAPEQWFDIADEAGLLIQNEYFIWTGREDWHKEWTRESLITITTKKLVKGKLVLNFQDVGGKNVSTREAAFQLNPLGQMTYVLPLETPRVKGNYLLKATAMPVGGPADEPTISRRKLKVEKSGGSRTQKHDLFL